MRSSPKMRSMLAGAVAVGFSCIGAITAWAQQQPAAAPTGQERDALIRSALSAAPPTLRDTVKVMDFNGNVLRDGPPGFTCLPAPPGLAGPMCLDDVWMGWLEAWSKRQPFTPPRVAFGYMLAGDSRDGGASNINPFDEQPTTTNDWMVEGPHLMVLVPDPALLAALPAEHHHGGPYVMWKGTPYAHIMVPVGERPEQRRVAGR
ncbi:hypothetical protein [Sabulicella rubraurantiaca]|uniref:hypothetical protein n=1 Tax=Sabulicella rubraurantiaca TaxID=2811429 RepID=UPI001F3AD806|nr:hypothetical protein [Sabulicella rubraurantiaca]